MHAWRGFTLIELIMVVLLIGILSAVALPRLSSKAGIDSVAARDALLSRLRLVQTMNMNEPPQQRTRMMIEQQTFAHITEPYIADNKVGTAQISDNTVSWRRLYNANINILLSSKNTYSIAFDRLGRAKAFDSAGAHITGCDNGCTLLIGPDNQKIIIESEGFIHAP